jgi:hypothetical protein
MAADEFYRTKDIISTVDNLNKLNGLLKERRRKSQQ